MSISAEDLDLVVWALDFVARIPSARKAARALDVSASTVSGWRKAEMAGKLEQLGEMREPMRSHLLGKRASLADARSRDGATAGDSHVAEVRTPPPSRDGIDSDAEFWREYRAIQASDLTEQAKFWKVDQLTMALRQLTQARDADAVLGRNRLMEKDVELMMSRAAAYSNEPPPTMPVVRADVDDESQQAS